MDRIKEIRKIVSKELSSSAHDLDHTMRVTKVAMNLAENEHADKEVIEIAALLHDIARVKEDNDTTGNTDHAELGAKMAEEILTRLNYPANFIQNVVHCIRTHRFRSKNKPKTIEAKILFDADKIDALGAIGIARAYMIAGERGEALYKKIDNLDNYKKKNLTENTTTGRIKDISKHSVNIEYETKFKKLPDILFTNYAKEIARKRLAFMDLFFSELEKEINGEA